MTVAGVVVLVAVWLLLWGDVSVANVVSGVAVATLLIAVFPTPHQASGLTLRPLPALRFVGYLLVNLVRANVTLSRGILARRTRIRTGIIAAPMDGCSPSLLALLANVIALTPGTMAVDVDVEPPTLYVHVLQLYDVERARHEVAHLRDLALRAFGPRP